MQDTYTCLTISYLPIFMFICSYYILFNLISWRSWKRKYKNIFNNSPFLIIKPDVVVQVLLSQVSQEIIERLPITCQLLS